MLSDRHYMRGQPTNRGFGPPQSVIKPLIIVNVVVFVLTGFGNDPSAGLMQVLALHPYHLRHFEVWRLLTHMFVHGSFFHIFFNMWGLYLFGTPVEQRLGPRRFLGLYFISGLVGGVAWLLVNWNVVSLYDVMVQMSPTSTAVRDPNVIATAAQIAGDPRIVEVKPVFGYVIGASGGVFGVMMACAMAFPNMRIMLLFPPIPMRIRTFVFVYGFIEVTSALGAYKGHGSGIAHLAHLGGLLGAFLYMKHLGFDSPYTSARTWLRKVISSHRRRRMHVVGGSQAPPRPNTGLPPDWEAQTDRILDKTGSQGINRLTPEERQLLEQARDRLRQRNDR